jgi:hypothetical protein
MPSLPVQPLAPPAGGGCVGIQAAAPRSCREEAINQVGDRESDGRMKIEKVTCEHDHALQ